MTEGVGERPEEILSPGHLACKGCGAALAMRFTLQALGRRTVLVVPASCIAVTDGPAPGHAFGVPMLHCSFPAAAAVATGVSAGLRRTGVPDVTVVAFAGDGGTMDIGLQALSGAAERNEDVLFICYDNEAYMNTGMQRSSATPEMAWTTTTPVERPKRGTKKRILEIMAAHSIPYAATASVSHPHDFQTKLRKARGIEGFRFFHVFAPCPTGWRVPSEWTVRLADLAVRSRIFPLLEVEGSKGGQERWSLTVDPESIPVEEYYRMQRRFAHLSARDLRAIQARVDREWKRIRGRLGLSASRRRP